MASGSPTSGTAEEGGVINRADIDVAAAILILGVAAQAEIRVGNCEHFAVDGTVGVVADSATFAHGFVLENHRPRLFAMALRATFVVAGQSQPTGRFGHVSAMRIVALGAIHAAFDHSMTMGQVKVGLDLEVASEAGARFFARIQNELMVCIGNMLAARTVAGLATRLAG